MTEASQVQPTAAKAGKKRIVAIAVVLGLATIGATYYVRSLRYEDTDDAQIDGSISNVSPRVSGTIRAVFVGDNQAVNAGDPLAEIDPKDLEVAVAQAKAAVAQAEAQLEAEDPMVPMTETTNQAALASASSDIASASAALAAAKKGVDQLTAQLAQAEANDRNAELEKQRAEKLVASGSISQAEADTRANAAAATAAAVEALRQALAAARDQVEQQKARLASSQTRLGEIKSNAPRQVQTRKASVAWRQASLDLVKAQLEQAELNLSYAKIIAPIAGIIGKKSLSIGDRVAPGQQLMAIAQTNDLYVTANFRETQLRRMKVGQRATIHVDAIDVDLRGTVESIGGATGSKMSVLPPENASGNYVKVVQRIPVRIRIDSGQAGVERLRIGMSVEPSVDLQ